MLSHSITPWARGLLDIIFAKIDTIRIAPLLSHCVTPWARGLLRLQARDRQLGDRQLGGLQPGDRRDEVPLTVQTNCTARSPSPILPCPMKHRSSPRCRIGLLALLLVAFETREGVLVLGSFFLLFGCLVCRLLPSPRFRHKLLLLTNQIPRFPLGRIRLLPITLALSQLRGL